MLPTLFLALGSLFFWLVFRAHASHEIQGRGWGFSTRTYQRESQPVWYWVTFASYLVCAVWATAFGVLAALRTFSSR